MARSSVGSLNDAREVLKEVDRRKSNLNYNLMLLERERTMSDTKTLLKIILTEGYAFADKMMQLLISINDVGLHFQDWPIYAFQIWFGKGES